MAATPAPAAAATLLAASPAVHPGCRLSPALTVTRSLSPPAENDPQQVTTAVMNLAEPLYRKAVGLTTFLPWTLAKTRLVEHGRNNCVQYICPDKPKWKRPPKRPSHKLEDNTRWDLI